MKGKTLIAVRFRHCERRALPAELHPRYDNYYVWASSVQAKRRRFGHQGKINPARAPLTKTMNIPTCPDCTHYENGFCRLVDKLASDYRNVEEIAGGCGDRGRFYAPYRDHSKRDWNEYPAKPEVWR